MDPDRHLPIPGRKHPLPMVSPSAGDHHGRPIAPSASTSQPSLPSIRQLHPYLPPSGATQPHLSTQDPPYGYAPPGAYASSSNLGLMDPHHGQSLPPQSGIYPRSEVPDSEPEAETEQPGPVKKKRRRQALSCNECKRRKIKCDRAQPCGPCTRRGEQSKCQWRTLEPVDKWITRAEYDELKSRTRAECDQLKARLDHVETMVSRIFSAPPGTINMPMYSMSPDMSGAPQSENIAYHAGHASTGPVLYSATMPPSSSYQAEHVSKPPQYSPHLVTSGTLPAITPAQPPLAAGGGGPSHVRRTSASETKSPTAVRQSPLSLASITTPYNTEAQSKNCHAQTPNMPGGRLRLVPLRDEQNGLAAAPPRCDTRQQRGRRRQRNTHTRPRQRAASQTLPWKDHLARLPWLSIYPDHRLGGDTETRA